MPARTNLEPQESCGVNITFVASGRIVSPKISRKNEL